MATETTPVPTGTTTSKGLTLPCPCCGEEESTITLNLCDMETFTCLECNSEFTLEYIHNLIAKWQRVSAWIDAAPIPPA